MFIIAGRRRPRPSGTCTAYPGTVVQVTQGPRDRRRDQWTGRAELGQIFKATPKAQTQAGSRCRSVVAQLPPFLSRSGALRVRPVPRPASDSAPQKNLSGLQASPSAAATVMLNQTLAPHARSLDYLFMMKRTESVTQTF